MVPGSILDHDAISSRLFYPWPDPFPDPFYVEGVSGRLGCWYGNLFKGKPTVIHFHGNGETVGEYRLEFAKRMAALEANLFLAEYRGYGMSEGRPQLVDMLRDVPCIVEACGVPVENIVFFGRSLGSLYAAHAAALYPRAGGLVLESGIADPLGLIVERVNPSQIGVSREGLGEEIARFFNQREKLAAFSGRTLVMHTRNDEIVPVSHAESLYAWAGGAKELVVFERGYHNNIREINETAYFGHLKKLLAESVVGR
jgi:pimeloyl-ACP methyl ester carboxylesterase